MSTNIEIVEKAANAARLELSEAEVEQFAQDLVAVQELAQTLEQVETADVTPLSQVTTSQGNVLRKDEARPSLPVEEGLRNTADHQDGQVKVPSVLE